MSDILKEARRVFEIEAKAVLALKDRISLGFEQAVDLINQCQGKVIVAGIGKSGQIGRKITSTFNSTGTPAVFLHPTESSHGDLGVIAANDIVIALSYRGETSEMADLLNFVARRGLKLIAMTGFPKSSLGKAADVVLDVSVAEEACPLGLAPTASSTAALAMGDALAICLMSKRGFKPEDFAEYHPGGTLGRKLLLRVKDLMHSGSEVAAVKSATNMKEVIVRMTAAEVRGVAVVVDESGNILGGITDGDIRRKLEIENPLGSDAGSMMNAKPKVIDVDEMAEKALFLMEQFSIQWLFVVDTKSATPRKLLGVIRLHDLLKSKLR